MAQEKRSSLGDSLKAPKSLAEPEKELRFTRARQARLFLFFAAISFAAAATLIATATAPAAPPFIWAPALLLIPLSVALILLAIRCARHAYLILSPLGIEIFPFRRPEKDLRVVYWSEIADAEIAPDHRRLTLHFTAEKSAGIVISLSPILRSRRNLLQAAVEGTLSKREPGAGDQS